MTRDAWFRWVCSVLLALLLTSCGGNSTPSADQQQSRAAAPASTANDTPAQITTPEPEASQPTIVLTGASGQPGGVALIEARLDTAGRQMSALQVDIALPPGLHVPPRPSGRPDCRVNPDIDKPGSSFTFQPSGCAGDACTGFRTLVIAADNVDPIPDGVQVFVCRVTIAVDAMDPQVISLSNVIMSTPSGGRIDGPSTDVPFELSGPPLPSPTLGPPAPTPTATSTAATLDTPTAAPTPAVVITDPAVTLSAIVAAPGAAVDIEVRLYFAHDEIIAGLQNDISFPPEARVAAKSNGKPNCRVNPDIVKPNTAFNFQPPFCTGTACTGMRALVLATGSADEVLRPIPNGAVAYTCTVDVADDAAGTLALRNGNVFMSDPSGNPIPGATGIDGAITVSGS